MSIGCCLSRAPTTNGRSTLSTEPDDEGAPEAQKQRFPIGAHEDKGDYDRNPDQRTAHDWNDGGQSTDRAPEHGRPNADKPET